MNPNEPFGLPNGTVRGVIAIGFTAVTLYLYATGQAVDQTLLGISTLIIGNYFGTRGSVETVRVEQVSAPYIPGDTNG